MSQARARPHLVIAVDGPTAAGKGTLARGLARHLGLAYLDTGTLYRAVAAKLLSGDSHQGNDPEADAAARIAASLSPGDLLRDDLRREAVGQIASKVAANPAVRAALLDFQRRFASLPPEGKSGAVLDGRDIGTVVCPDAIIKFFVTASLATRARRRHEELIQRGEASIYARVLQEMQERDARDEGRAAAPLKAADDAIVIDTTEMDAETVLARALAMIEARLKGASAT